MSDSIEDRIAEVVESQRPAQPNVLSLVVWGLIGIVALGFSLILLTITFILLRTLFLYGFAQLTGSY
ncbi:MAG: hypothetical protein K8L99_02750 [Anaerolineae bacterium]|nr:hypothetical protein [Anaerolineae bacterium]